MNVTALRPSRDAGMYYEINDPRPAGTVARFRLEEEAFTVLQELCRAKGWEQAQSLEFRELNDAGKPVRTWTGDGLVDYVRHHVPTRR